MNTLTIPKRPITGQIDQLFKRIEERAAKHDKENLFVEENYQEMKSLALFSAMIPKSIGGGGHSYHDICHLIRQMGQRCGSTALAFSMHQHLVAAACWKWQNRELGRPLLEMVAKQEIVLVSTGARDWLSSNGELEKVSGGYLLTARKSFASGCVVGDVAITSAPYKHPVEGWQVLHFPVSLAAEGVTILRDWDVMGMRGTGSNTIECDQVFIGEENIALTRPQSTYHPAWNVILTVAMPLIMSAYVGIAERGAALAVEAFRKNHKSRAHLPYLLGKLNNQLVAAKVQWKAMTKHVNEFQFTPEKKSTSEVLALKTNVSEACINTVELALELVGGRGFYRTAGLERLFRDVQASRFHPLPKWEQYQFSADLMM